MNTSKYQSRYYYVTETGSIEYEINRCERADVRRLLIGNYFKTVKEAKESTFYKFYHNDDDIKNKNKELELFELCMRVNKETKHDTFFYFSGHVNNITVSIYINGYHEYDKKLELYRIYVESPKNPVVEFKEWELNNFEEKRFDFLH